MSSDSFHSSISASIGISTHLVSILRNVFRCYLQYDLVQGGTVRLSFGFRNIERAQVFIFTQRCHVKEKAKSTQSEKKKRIFATANEEVCSINSNIYI